ncbi:MULTISPECIES: hypothetical protein [unclassified Nonomuraea]|uniref:hypothetical protein n=1 Tax=unclassified Nonomuraea TaxID=2593643 RepID=UPI0033F8A921
MTEDRTDPARARLTAGCRVAGALDARAVPSSEVLEKLAAPAPSSAGVIDAVTTVVHSGSAAQSEFSSPAPQERRAAVPNASWA